MVDLKKDKHLMFNVVALKRMNRSMIKSKTIVSQVFCSLHLVSETFRLFGAVMAVRGSVIDCDFCR